ncbi:MAG: hypothetical protein J6S85_24235 [Methanobrevibacter sp.]|nr:hypothetical protein [Methanobrevibacter sp.]
MDWNKELKNDLFKRVERLDAKNKGNYKQTMNDIIKGRPNEHISVDKSKVFTSVTISKNLSRNGIQGRGNATINFRKDGGIDSIMY